jgi:hypothetical protein
VDTDIMKGNPEYHVLGKPEEKPARVHAPLPPRKPPVTLKTIRASVKFRMQELEPFVGEFKRLEEANNRLSKIK